LAYQEQHGAVFNHLTVINHSPFRVTSVKITVSIRRTDGKTDPVVLFGGNIRKVDVWVECAEARPPFGGDQPPPPPIFDVEPADTKPEAEPEAVVLTLAEAPLRPQRNIPGKPKIPALRPADVPPETEEEIPVLKAADEPPQPDDEVVVLQAFEEIRRKCARCRSAGKKERLPCPVCGFVPKKQK
jgi:hypothetical protein